MKKIILVLTLVFITIGLYCGDTDLKLILSRAGDYCEKLEHSAFRYFCHEQIEEEFLPFPKYFRYNPAAYKAHMRLKKVNRYLYDYQMLKKGSKIEEQRVLLEHNGRKIGKAVDKTSLKSFYSERSFFGPIGLIGKKARDLYRYRLLKRDGNIAVVEAKLKKRSGKRSSAILWVDSETGAVRKIEVDVKSMPGYVHVRKFESHWGTKADIKVVHEYGKEYNGLLYPVKTVFIEKYTGGLAVKRKFPRSGVYNRSRAEIQYKKYRFFDVKARLAD